MTPASPPSAAGTDKVAIRPHNGPLAAMFEDSAEAILVLCAYRLVYANAAFVRLLRAGDLTELLDLQITDVCSLPAAPLSDFSAVLPCMDGSTVELDFDVTSIRLAGALALLCRARDSAPRRGAEFKIAADQARLREMFEVNPHPMAVFDSETLRFLDVNDATVARYGYSREEFLRLGLLDIFVPEDAQRLRAIQASGNPVLRQLKGFRHRLRSGEIIDVEIDSHTLIHQGRPARLVAVFEVTERVRTERSLRESEAFNRAVFEKVGVGMARVSLSGRYVDVNNKLTEILGFTREELLNLNFQSITHPEDLAEEFDLADKLRSGRGDSFAMEKRYRLRDGSVRWVKLTSALVHDAAGNASYFISVFEDIDERKRASRTLVEMNERYTLAVAASNTGIWDWDCESGTVTYSPEWKSQLGYLDHEIGDSYTEWESRVHPDDLPGVKTMVDEYVRGDGADYLIMEYRLRHKNGRYRWILSQSRSISGDRDRQRLLGSHIDITVRKSVEEALRDSEEKYRRLVELSPDAVLVVQQGRVVFANSATHHLLCGPGQPDPVGRLVSDFLVLPRDFSFDFHFTLAAATQVAASGVELAVASPLSRARHVDLRSAPVKWEGALAHKLIARDITESKRIQQVLQEYAQRLKGLSQQLLVAEETQRQLLQRELHDRVSQNLSALGVTLNVLDSLLPTEVRALVTKPLHAAQVLILDTTRQVRNLMGELQPPGLREYGLVTALRSYAEATEERSAFTVELDADDDPGRLPDVTELTLFRIVQEAMSNTAKHAGARRVHIRFKHTDTGLRLLVEDDGCGFNTEAVRGPHWGLSIMRERAEAIGADLHVRSVPGAGTRVAVDVRDAPS